MTKPSWIDADSTIRSKWEQLCHQAVLTHWIHLPIFHLIDLVINRKKITEISDTHLGVEEASWNEKAGWRRWENRLLTNTSCSNLFQTDWTFYKNRFLIIFLSAFWTKISWLRTIRKVSSLFKPKATRRVLLKLFFLFYSYICKLLST